MKVILMQELKGRGGEGDVVDVARGFAVNYLLPRKLAIEATSGNLKQLEQRKHNIEKRESQRMNDAGSMQASLEGKTVTISAKVGEEGRLFGSVTTPMIEAAVLEQLGVEVDRRKIDTHGHIKEAGLHVVDVSVYRDVKAQLTVQVVAEGAVISETAVIEVEVEDVTSDSDAFVEIAEVAADEADEPAIDEQVEDADSE